MATRRYPSILSTALLLAAGAAFVPPASAQDPEITHGMMIGDVRSTSAVIWSRADRASFMHVALEGGPYKTLSPKKVKARRDYTGRVNLRGLAPDTDYQVWVWFSDFADAVGAPTVHAVKSAALQGEFRTAPYRDQPKPVKLVWGGDVAGQNVCRDAVEGFPIFETISAYDPDIFVAAGDMIYADVLCEAVGTFGNAQVPADYIQAIDQEQFWEHWKYARGDSKFQEMARTTPYIASWDDHEVVNDFGPLSDTRDDAPYTAGVHLLPIGRQAFFDYHPIGLSVRTPNRLYRNIRWGQHLEIFVLDNRQYRDANLTEDSAERPKTMLGREQLEWLKSKLDASTATWKLIVSSVPISIPTGFPPSNGRDGWANFDQSTGFENELRAIFDFLHEKDVRNTFWITTDVHFAEAFRYTPYPEDPDFQIHELVSGPLNSGLFPIHDFDTDLGTESLFFFGPAGIGVVTEWEEAKTWFNFGVVEIDVDGNLSAQIRDATGEVEYELLLSPDS